MANFPFYMKTSFQINGNHVNSHDKNKWTRLHYAAFYSNLDAVEFLVNSGADVNARDDVGNTPLHYCQDSQYTEKIVKLLLGAGAEFGAVNERKQTPMFYAMRNNQVKFLGALLIFGKDAKDFGPTRDDTLLKSMFESCLPCVELLLAAGADVNLKDDAGNTLLHKVAYNGCRELTEYLLNNGADITAQDNYGYTPLHDAARAYRKQTLRILLDAGADVNVKDNNGKYAIHEILRNAISIKYSDIFERMKPVGFDSESSA